MERIPVAGPWITEKEIAYVTDAAATAWYSEAGKYNGRFEKAFAAYVGREHAISLPSCTSALHLSLLALDLKPGDEVIVPEITWIASAAPITYVGATPVFADIDPKTWCLSAGAFEARITNRTRAVIVVDLYGNVPDMDALLAVAQRHGIAVIEDAAQSVGTEYRGRKAGSFGTASTFSFHGTKTLTTGEGGMLLTDDKAVYERCLFLRDHGRQPGSKLFWNAEVGYKYRMSSLQAALGLGQIERVEELVARKRQQFAWYARELGGVDGITLNYQAPDVRSTYWMNTVILDERYGLPKERLMELLRERNIDSRPFFYPLSSLPAYAHLEQVRTTPQQNPVAYRLSPYALNLPSALCLTEEQIVTVCRALKEILKAHGG